MMRLVILLALVILYLGRASSDWRPRMTVYEAMAEEVTVKEAEPPAPREWVQRTYTYDALLEDFDGEYDLVGTLIKKNRVLAAEVRALRQQTRDRIDLCPYYQSDPECTCAICRERRLTEQDAALRHRLAVEVEAAYREGHADMIMLDANAAWIASDAKRGLG